MGAQYVLIALTIMVLISLSASPGQAEFYETPVLVTTLELTVTQGTTGTITSGLLEVTDVDNTPDQLQFTVRDAPLHGTLRNGGTAMGGGDVFTQADINGGLITYDHDGSPTLADQFTFSVVAGAGGMIGKTM